MTLSMVAQAASSFWETVLCWDVGLGEGLAGSMGGLSSCLYVRVLRDRNCVCVCVCVCEKETKARGFDESNITASERDFGLLMSWSSARFHSSSKSPSQEQPGEHSMGPAQ
jgi:hypothetical protein